MVIYFFLIPLYSLEIKCGVHSNVLLKVHLNFFFPVLHKNILSTYFSEMSTHP